MKGYRFLALAFFLCLLGCGQQTNDKELLQRSFYETIWERFDYVTTDVNITKATTYDLTLRISFTDAYSYNDISWFSLCSMKMAILIAPKVTSST
jgi:hypothetical protein